MKPIKFSPEIKKHLSEIQKKDKKFYQRILKQLMLFQQNPKSKSLRLHKVTREIQNSWSISISMSFRMVYTETEKEYYFYKIGTHDEVYRKR